MDPLTLALVGGSLLNGIMGSNAAGDAADAQTQANNAALANSNAQWAATQKNLAPWRTTGQAAQNRLAIMLGLQPDQSKMPQSFNEQAYLAANPDVDAYFKSQAGIADKAQGGSPWQQYQDFGVSEGRNMGVGNAPVDYTKDPLWGTGIMQKPVAYGAAGAPGMNVNALRQSIMGK